MLKKMTIGLFCVSSLCLAQTIDIQKNNWQMESNILNTELNTTQLDDKNINALWTYRDKQWYFYSSDATLQNSVNYNKIESIKQNESFWVYSNTENNLTIEENLNQLYFIPDIATMDFTSLDLTSVGDTIKLSYKDKNGILNTRILNKITGYNEVYGYSGNTEQQIILNMNHLGFIKLDLKYGEDINIYYLSTKNIICIDEKYKSSIPTINSVNNKQITCQ